MDALDYDSLLNETKASLRCNVQMKKTFPSHFTSLLENCRVCITQSIDYVVDILSDANVIPSNLSQYMENSICLLQMLSNLIKNMVESISMSCCSFKTFPTTTGHIIMLVFTHCKNSEAVYGVQLKNVQMQLKDLFRTCHELQLTYLMVLERRFIFDLTEREQLDILIEALDINLKIGEMVQSLDVKTMAEQWKAYTGLCEKYSSHLMDKLIYEQCIQTLCSMVMNNFKTAQEVDQDEKVIMRSIKVTNFVIKVMLKIFIIFKHASLKDYSQIVEMLIFVHLYNPPNHEPVENQTQLIPGMTTNNCIPDFMQLMELIWDEKFIYVVATYDINNISEDEKMIGYILLVVSIMELAVDKEEQIQNFPKLKLLDCVFRCLSCSHVWMNIGFKFKSGLNHQKSYGLFENVLVHTTALALTLNSQEMCNLENLMYEAILGTEYVTALFASNLWTVLARLSNNKELLLTQLISLCRIYQKLESHKLFGLSPQKQQLDYILSNLFECLRKEDRISLYRQFNPLDSTNMSLWAVLKIGNLPIDVQGNIQEEILQSFKKQSTMKLDTKESVDGLVKIMKLAASCSLHGDDDVAEYLTKAWMNACPKNYTFLSKTVDTGTLWYFEYVGALVTFTFAMEENIFCQNKANFTKVLHVISNIIQLDNIELNLLLIDLLCNLAKHTIEDENKHSADNLLNESFRKIMIQDWSKTNVVKYKLFRIINTYDNKRLELIISSVIDEYPVLQELWDTFFQSRNFDKAYIKQQLIITGDFKFVHKCMEKRLETENYKAVVELKNTCNSNFDFADLDTLFDNESDPEQPVSKKMKLDSSEAQEILNELEKYTLLLCTLKDKVFTSEERTRIKDLSEKLRSIVD